MKKKILNLNSSVDERKDDAKLRPATLSEYIGQEKLKGQLKIYVDAARKRKDQLDHCLFYGPPGLGKTTLAYIIANELKVNIKTASGPTFEKPADIASVLSNLEEGDVLFIDEIHRINSAVEEVLYSEEVLSNRIAAMASDIDKDYNKSIPLVIGILNGVAPFMVSLINKITIPMNMDFIKVKSYSGVSSTGTVSIIGYIPDVKNRDVILCDDILDTGRTIFELKEKFLSLGAKSVKVAVLLNKIGTRVMDIEADYKGFDVPNKFVVGFGLDYNELYRNLPYIGVLKEEIYK